MRTLCKIEGGRDTCGTQATHWAVPGTPLSHVTVSRHVQRPPPLNWKEYDGQDLDSSRMKVVSPGKPPTPAEIRTKGQGHLE